MFANILTAVLAVMNMAAFALMGVDKTRAKAGRRRIRETTLFLTTALFGGLGGTLGMLTFRHKTRHWYFKLGFPMLLAAQIFAIGLVIGQML